MKGDAEVLKRLNLILKNELTAINQYFLHSRIFNDWGLDDIGEHEYKKSIKDMKQADKLIARILFLDGLPNLQDLGKLRIGENTEEIVKCDLALEEQSIADLRDAIALCEKKGDFISRELLDGILEDEEEYLDWLETQISLIKDMGLPNYIQSQA
ncbi:MAG: bacterioferritin [Alphaproteobacteria bacterium]|jgi:bacterioferritin|nr:bacterioferritin [Magnetovibrio sp.]HBC07253.1 bacterioferritin [Rhodospirillaceae bacterium]HBT42127.1 bacterioferritin [Rhodospirillaceae bacterium]HCS69332.1 bacterioferritin [Rhodospirillaceae bacterium]|tara:strand:- start:1243 stop:1707 length:465 start_codon:yes stop_codon:yes gene_type:complete